MALALGWPLPAKPWSATRLAMTLAGSFFVLLLSLCALVILLAVLANKLMPYDDLGVGLVLVLFGFIILAPLLWLGWICLSAWFLTRHGGERIWRRLPLVYAGLGFLGFLPVTWNWVEIVVILRVGPAAKKPSELLTVAPYALPLALALGGLAFLVGKKLKLRGGERARGPAHPAV